MHRLSCVLSLLGLGLALASVLSSWALPAPAPAPAPQVVITATVPTDVTLPTTVPLPSVDVPTPIFTTVPATPSPTSTQDGGDGSSASATPAPSIVVLPGFAGVTRTQPPAQASDTLTATDTFTSSVPMQTRTVVLTLTDIVPVVTATVTVPQGPPRPTPNQGQKLHRRKTGQDSNQQPPGSGNNGSGGGDESQAQEGASMQVFGQAYIFNPPSAAQGALDPYAGAFRSFTGFNLRQDQEQRLLNRSYYFKGQPYSGQVQVQLSANKSTANQSPPVNIPPIRFPVPRPAPQLAWESPDKPDVSRKNTTIGIDSTSASAGVVDLAGTEWFDLPQAFIPRQPVANQLGSVFMPYQVATLQEGEPKTPEPQNAESSYLVLAPEIGSVSGGGDQSGGQGQPTDGGSGSSQDPSQEQPGQGGQQSQVVLSKHVAVVSEVDDVLKETQLSSPRQALLNSFAEIYQPTPGMPNIFQGTLAQSYANNATALTFHYVTGAPVPLAPSYLQFLNAFYPYGSLTMRPIVAYDEQSFIDRLKDGSTYKLAAAIEVLTAFPDARVVVFAEANSLQTYVDLVAEFPSQVACLYLRKATLPGSSQDPSQQQPGLPDVTQERAVEQLRQRLPQEMGGRAGQMIKVFSNPAELLGLNYTTSPIRCA